MSGQEALCRRTCGFCSFAVIRFMSQEARRTIKFLSFSRRVVKGSSGLAS